MTTVSEALAETERLLDEADAQLAWAQGRYDEAQAIHEGLRLAQEKFNLAPDDEIK